MHSHSYSHSHSELLSSVVAVTVCLIAIAIGRSTYPERCPGDFLATDAFEIRKSEALKHCARAV